MKKMLKILINLIVYVGLLIIGYYLPYDIEVYKLLDEKIIPVICGVAGGVISLVSVLKPVISKLDTSGEKLTKSIDDNNDIVKENKFLNEKLEIALNDVNLLNSQVNSLIEIVKLGFGNDENLVKKGIASKIYKIGENDEN